MRPFHLIKVEFKKSFHILFMQTSAYETILFFWFTDSWMNQNDLCQLVCMAII